MDLSPWAAHWSSELRFVGRRPESAAMASRWYIYIYMCIYASIYQSINQSIYTNIYIGIHICGSRTFGRSLVILTPFCSTETVKRIYIYINQFMSISIYLSIYLYLYTHIYISPLEAHWSSWLRFAALRLGSAAMASRWARAGTRRQSWTVRCPPPIQTRG